MDDFSFKLITSPPYFIQDKKEDSDFVVKKEHFEHKNYHYVFGYSKSDKDFVAAIIQLKHLTFQQFSCQKHPTNRDRYVISIPFTLHDSKGNSKEFLLTHTDPANFYLPNILKKISYLNHFIELFDDVNSVDTDKFEKLFKEHFHFHVAHPILASINQLDVAVYENSRSIFNKDDKFWIEIEIRNFPNEKYLTDQFLKILIKHYGGYDKIEDGYMFQGENKFAYVRAFPRTKIDEDWASTEVKVMIAFELGKFYDENVRISYLIHQ